LFVVTRGDNWYFLNAEDPAGVIRTDAHGHGSFLDGVFRGEFGGPGTGRTQGLTTGAAALVRRHPITGAVDIGKDDDPLTCARKTWAALAPLIAAEPAMSQFDSHDRLARRDRLAAELPDAPAALPIYRDGATRILALDFDGPGASARIDADVQQMLCWIAECGGEAITDRTITGSGRHVLVPLSAEAAHADLVPTLRSLAALLPTLDITPMLHHSHGAITPPGSRTRSGGFRVLDRSIGSAVQALTIRSAPGFLDRLALLTGVFHHTG
jgi:hypothetical protein